MVQPHYNFGPYMYLQIETKYIFNHFIYFSKSFGKMPIANPFIVMVKAGRKLATPPDLLIAKGRNSDCTGCIQFRVLVYHKHVNILDRPNYEFYKLFKFPHNPG